MMDTYHELIDELSETPGRLRDLVSRQPTPARPTGEEWGITEIVAHLADVERLYRGRMQAVLTQNTPYLRTFDPEAAAREGNYASRDLYAVVADFGAERAETVSLLMTLAIKQWERTGIHDEMGEVSVEDLAERLIEHDAEHVAQIERIIAG